MVNTNNYIASQQIVEVSHAYGKAISQIIDRLKTKLRYDAAIAWQKTAVTPRGYMELREAKALLSQLRYPDSTGSVREDEMAWAIMVIKEACAKDAAVLETAILDKVAEMLEIDPVGQSYIPLDMQRKINNEMQLLQGISSPVPLAQAV